MLGGGDVCCGWGGGSFAKDTGQAGRGKLWKRGWGEVRMGEGGSEQRPHQSLAPPPGFREKCGSQQGEPEDQQCRGGGLAELSRSTLLTRAPI